jgi:hypothetical protein
VASGRVAKSKRSKGGGGNARRPRERARKGKALAGSINLEPILEMTGSPINVAPEIEGALLGKAPARDLIRNCFLPTRELTLELDLSTKSQGGYQDPPNPEAVERHAAAIRAGTDIGSRLVAVSGRNAWQVGPKEDGKCEIRVFDSAPVISGQLLMAALARVGRDNKQMLDLELPFLLIPELKRKEEIELADAFREDSLRESSGLPLRGSLLREDERPDRLIVGVDWVEVEIATEPVLTTTSLGYAPMLLVKETDSGAKRSLLIGAKSLGVELEEVRRLRGSLIGVTAQIRKRTSHHQAPYEIQFGY